MSSIFEALTRRKAQLAQQRCSRWQQLVTAVADGKADPDATLAELERCERTINDLEAAVELLRQRREWARQLESGLKAEDELVDVDKNIERFRLKKEAAENALAAEGERLASAKSAIVARITQAAAAKRSLIATASTSAKEQATAAVDAQIAAAQQEQATIDNTIADKTRALELTSDPDQGARLRRELGELAAKRAGFNERFAKLHADHDREMTVALNPTCL